MPLTEIVTSIIADNAITHAKMADNSVGHDEMRDNAVGHDEMRNASVGTAELIDASVTPAKLSQPLTLETAKASTSGTSIDFPNIPAWVKRITVMFAGVSTSGTSSVQVQLGTGAGPTFTTSGYLGASMAIANAASSVGEQNGAGFRVYANSAAASVNHGNIVITNVTGNTWSMSSVFGQSDSARVSWAGGSIALAAALTAIRITTVGGTDTFDAGSINIMYE
jgi:hypothetical protein